MRAQNLQDPSEIELDGREATPAERDAWSQVEQGRYVKARELGEQILQRDPNSFVEHTLNVVDDKNMAADCSEEDLKNVTPRLPDGLLKLCKVPRLSASTTWPRPED